MSPIIEARNLTKSYGNFLAVKNLNFSIQTNECFGILGPNGAGKTTTLKMLYGTSPLSKGDLFIMGMNARKNLKTIKKEIGVVSQDNGLDPDFTVLDNLIVYGRYFRMKSHEAKRKAKELLRFMHLDNYMDMPVESLSGGMKRRLTIARALMTDPKILFLDEPTTGLDPQARLWIWENLLNLKRKGVTLVLTTHYMEEAEYLCDRLFIIDKGDILCEGVPSDLIRSTIGSEVVEFHVEMNDLEYHLKKIRDRFDYQIFNNRIRLFVPINQQAKDIISEVTSDNIVVRRASLDDVFLKVAGYDPTSSMGDLL
ncbi:MAG: ABC transporter ATP-binding protein [Bdellovibrionales bacterium]|nr:ABC transporter ATP-binding protein [Bdellovibrionales bacterium]